MITLSLEPFTASLAGLFVSTPLIDELLWGMIGLAARCRAAKPGLVLVFVLTPQPLDLLPIAIGLCLIPIDLLLLMVIGYLMAL